jgi:hypothetical protein
MLLDLLAELLLPPEREWPFRRQVLHQSLRGLLLLIPVTLLFGLSWWSVEGFSLRSLAGPLVWLLPAAVSGPVPLIWTVHRWPVWSAMVMMGVFAFVAWLSGALLFGIALSSLLLLACAAVAIVLAGTVWFSVRKQERELRHDSEPPSALPDGAAG